MSKDFRPCDLYIADKVIKEKEGKGLRDLKVVWKNPNTNDEIIIGNEEAKKEYPEMSFLFDDFNKLYEESKDNKNALKLFDDFEEALCVIETEFDAGQKSADLRLYVKEDISNEPVKDVVQEWFYGRLDSNFYYNEWNNRLLTDYMKEKIDNLKEKQIERE